MWTIELNLDDDFSNTCAWHICEEVETVARHFHAALERRKLDRWVYMGAAATHEEAHKLCKGLRQEMCKRSGRQEMDLQDAYDKFAQAICDEED